MPWVRYAEEHRCDKPSQYPPLAGSVWQCEGCGQLWQVTGQCPDKAWVRLTALPYDHD